MPSKYRSNTPDRSHCEDGLTPASSVAQFVDRRIRLIRRLTIDLQAASCTPVFPSVTPPESDRCRFRRDTHAYRRSYPKTNGGKFDFNRKFRTLFPCPTLRIHASIRRRDAPVEKAVRAIVRIRGCRGSPRGRDRRQRRIAGSRLFLCQPDPGTRQGECRVLLGGRGLAADPGPAGSGA